MESLDALATAVQTNRGYSIDLYTFVENNTQTKVDILGNAPFCACLGPMAVPAPTLPCLPVYDQVVISRSIAGMGCGPSNALPWWLRVRISQCGICGNKAPCFKRVDYKCDATKATWIIIKKEYTFDCPL